MQNIDLICVGKLNAPYFAAGVAEYQKRLIELPEAAIADKNASDAQISKALDKEANRHSFQPAQRGISRRTLRGR